MVKRLAEGLLVAICLAAALDAGPLLAAEKKVATSDKPPVAAQPAKNQTANPAAAGTPRPKDAEAAVALRSSAKKRPAGVDAPSGLIEEGYQKIVVVGPYSTEPECHREIPAKLVEAVDEYAQAYDPKLGPRLRITGETLRAEQPRLVREEFSETIFSSVGPMRQIHLRLVFDRKFNRWLDQQLAQSVVARRVGMLAAAGGCVLVLLTLAWLVARRRGGLAKEA